MTKGTALVQVLVVEDETKVARALGEGLTAEGYRAVLASTGEEAFFLACSQAFDAIVLDIGLPGRSGLEVLRALRQRGVTTPALLLTARDSVEDRVNGLDAGADDYLVKPFAFAELLARIRALLRRGRPDLVMRFKAGPLELDALTRSVTVAGDPIEVTGREFELLEYLLRHQGQHVSRDMLAAEVWREPARGTPLDNVIDVHIGRIRRKLEHGRAYRFIHTIRGVGFVLRAEGV